MASDDHWNATQNVGAAALRSAQREARRMNLRLERESDHLVELVAGAQPGKLRDALISASMHLRDARRNLAAAAQRGY